VSELSTAKREAAFKESITQQQQQELVFRPLLFLLVGPVWNVGVAAFTTAGSFSDTKASCVMTTVDSLTQMADQVRTSAIDGNDRARESEVLREFIPIYNGYR
jgi:hypothetical protein